MILAALAALAVVGVGRGTGTVLVATICRRSWGDWSIAAAVSTIARAGTGILDTLHLVVLEVVATQSVAT